MQWGWTHVLAVRMALCSCSYICLLCTAFILCSPLWKTPEKSWDRSNAMAFTALTLSQHKELPRSQLSAGSLKMSQPTWAVEWDGKSLTIYPRDWSEVTCAVYPTEAHWATLWRAGLGTNTVSMAASRPHMVENSQYIPREAARSSSVKDCCLWRCSISCQIIWTWRKWIWKHIHAGMWGTLASK